MKQTTVGYIVAEWLEFGFINLDLLFGKGLPASGILGYPERNTSYLFPSRAQARAAINRSHHYYEAYGIYNDRPYKSGMEIIEVKGPK